jgi:hypothetical protein
MGFFSWKTNNSDRSIANRYSDRSTFKVYMRDNKGNVWVEEDYEGYGRFGGKDYYELLAEMNGLGSDRCKGIWLQYDSKRTDIIYPALFDNPDSKWEDYRGVAPENCESQGYFYCYYDDDDEEDGYY